MNISTGSVMQTSGPSTVSDNTISCRGLYSLNKNNYTTNYNNYQIFNQTKSQAYINWSNAFSAIENNPYASSALVTTATQLQNTYNNITQPSQLPVYDDSRCTLNRNLTYDLTDSKCIIPIFPVTEGPTMSPTPSPGSGPWSTGSSSGSSSTSTSSASSSPLLDYLGTQASSSSVADSMDLSSIGLGSEPNLYFVPFLGLTITDSVLFIILIALFAVYRRIK
jgi:hypothetical protein